MDGYRQVWLFAASASALLACLVSTAILFISISPFVYAEEVTNSIGEFPSKDLAIRASIKKLASEIHRCPEAQTYRIIWSVKNNPTRQATVYHRKSNSIGYEQDAFSGYVGRRYIVGDAAIEAVAERGGMLEDFAEYD